MSKKQWGIVLTVGFAWFLTMSILDAAGSDA